MNTKTSNKLNILLVAITLLLVFVACFKGFGRTNSWLINNDEIGFEVKVNDINIVVKQDARTVEDDGNIYLGTNIIEADKTYDLNITITNSEQGEGYFIRCQLIAVLDGTVYNLNNCAESDFYKDSDGWMYSAESKDSSTRKQMASNETKTIIDTLQFTNELVSLSQGKYIKLYLYIEGNAIADFNS